MKFIKNYGISEEYKRDTKEYEDAELTGNIVLLSHYTKKIMDCFIDQFKNIDSENKQSSRELKDTEYYPPTESKRISTIDDLKSFAKIISPTAFEVLREIYVNPGLNQTPYKQNLSKKLQCSESTIYNCLKELYDLKLVYVSEGQYYPMYNDLTIDFNMCFKKDEKLKNNL